MRQYVIICVLAMFFVACGTDKSEETVLRADNIEEIIKAMTIDEKVHLLVGARSQEVTDTAEQLVVASYKKLVPGCAGPSFPISRLGIPAIITADGPCGLRIYPTRENDNQTYYCTAFPNGTLMASTWDTELVEKTCQAMGEEVREYGVDILLAPGMNIMRNPLCGRNFEYYSEDPLLSGKSAAAFVRGVQSQGVGTSIKHFCANNEEINRLSSDSRVSVRTLREIYLKNFEIAVKEGNPWTVMSSYNYLNGKYTSERRDLLEDVLRGDWGYRNLVISDWGGGYDAPSQIASGNDLIFPGRDWQYNNILQAVKEGTLQEDLVDMSVRRMLQLIVKTPRFKGYKYSNKPDLVKHAAVSRNAASQGMVLLKNDGALPLREFSTVALFGVNSYDMIAGGTGAAHVNKPYIVNMDEGLKNAGFSIYKDADKQYREWIQRETKRLQSDNEKRSWWFAKLQMVELPPAILSEAAKYASSACKSAIITISRQSGEGNDRHIDNDFNLKPEEVHLIRTVCEAFHSEGGKVTVVLNACGAVEMSSWRDYPDAILMAWQPGQEAGNAVVDILSGKVNPSGRLPLTFPIKYADVPSGNFPAMELEGTVNYSYYRHTPGKKVYEVPNVDYVNYDEGVFVGYRHYVTRNVPVAYPFGFGLSYTVFEYSGMEVRRCCSGWKVKVCVKNTGSVPGREVVQLYSSHPSDKDAPLRELRAFTKTSLLAPGESQTVTLSLDKNDLAIFDENISAWVISKGEYVLSICKNASDVIFESKVKILRDSEQKTSHSLYPEGPLFIK